MEAEVRCLCDLDVYNGCSLINMTSYFLTMTPATALFGLYHVKLRASSLIGSGLCFIMSIGTLGPQYDPYSVFDYFHNG